MRLHAVEPAGSGAGVSPPGATHFLCRCKESKQRKHLEELAVVGVGIGRFAPGGAARCSRKVLLDTQGSRKTQRTFARRARHKDPHGIPNSDRWPVSAYGWSAGTRTLAERGVHCSAAFAASPVCRATLCENTACHRPERSDRSIRLPLHVLQRCFLCFLSLHQQRKGVGPGAETPAAFSPTAESGATTLPSR